MRFSDAPLNTYFAPITLGDMVPLYHRGKDGVPRLVVGGWTGHRTKELGATERKSIENAQIQALFITPVPQGD